MLEIVLNFFLLQFYLKRKHCHPGVNKEYQVPETGKGKLNEVIKF